MSTLHELKYFAWAPSPSVFFFGMAAPFKPFFWRETTPPPHPKSHQPRQLVRTVPKGAKLPERGATTGRLFEL